MKTVLVRYKTRDDKASENEALVRAMFEELRASRLAGIRYASFKLADGKSFIHFAAVETADGSNPLASLASFKQFQQGLRDRCVEPPVALDLAPVDDYGFLK